MLINHLSAADAAKLECTQTQKTFSHKTTLT